MPAFIYLIEKLSRHGFSTGVCIVCMMFITACSESSRPPFIKAQVVDVYNTKTDIYNAHFHYQWQERGETAFLDSNDFISRELMVTVISKNSPEKVDDSSALRLHLMNINKIEWVITKTGKEMRVYPAQGEPVETKCLFPQELRVDPASGLADYSCSIIGSRNENSRTIDFSQSLDFLKSIVITGVDKTD